VTFVTLRKRKARPKPPKLRNLWESSSCRLPGTDLTAYLALFATLRRDNRNEQVKPILEGVDLAKVQSTPGQKMHLAQEFLAAGLSETAFSFGYEVLRLGAETVVLPNAADLVALNPFLAPRLAHDEVEAIAVTVPPRFAVCTPRSVSRGMPSPTFRSGLSEHSGGQRGRRAPRKPQDSLTTRGRR
jgi:hypothetical protein